MALKIAKPFTNYVNYDSISEMDEQVQQDEQDDTGESDVSTDTNEDESLDEEELKAFDFDSVSLEEEAEELDLTGVQKIFAKFIVNKNLRLLGIKNLKLLISSIKSFLWLNSFSLPKKGARYCSIGDRVASSNMMFNHISKSFFWFWEPKCNFLKKEFAF